MSQGASGGWRGGRETLEEQESDPVSSATRPIPTLVSAYTYVLVLSHLKNKHECLHRGKKKKGLKT